MSADKEIINITADIVKAHVSNNAISSSDICALINDVYNTLSTLGQAPPAAQGRIQPATSIAASVTDDYLICLEDGKKFKMLKRHLMAHYQMTPDEYREKWNLPKEYPMIAPNYLQKRRELATKLGLGDKSVPAKPIARRGRGRPRK